MSSLEHQLEEELIGKLRALKYQHREDIRDRAALEKNFREKFEALDRVRLTDGEFQRLLDEMITPDVFTAAHTLREEPRRVHHGEPRQRVRLAHHRQRQDRW